MSTATARDELTGTGSLALVSGGTRGIGRALSERLARRGHQVIALYRADEAAARATEADLGPAVRAVRADVTDPDAVAGVVADAVERYGPPRVVVNNAGVNIDKPFLQSTPAEWHTVIGTSLFGALNLTHACAPHMLDRPGGSIVNIGATTGLRPRTDGAAYCAAKAALLHLTKCLALELAPAVRVNCIIPGMTETDELTTRYRLDDPQHRAAVLSEIPQRRIARTDDIADALEYLVGPLSSYVTGQKLIVDGGQFMW